MKSTVKFDEHIHAGFRACWNFAERVPFAKFVLNFLLRFHIFHVLPMFVFSFFSQSILSTIVYWRYFLFKIIFKEEILLLLH